MKNADLFKDTFGTYATEIWSMSKNDFLKWLNENVESKIGHWIYDDECHEHGHCSECGYGRVDLVNGEPHNFCRRCGAKMIEPQERSDKG